ncbi:glycosyltransferase family 2 protein [Marinomonas sp. 2405UD66-6]|uniref:glycosyltransferase family 2 protein n=1 Tax=Marinomonas sp. 2405UD66-6 TaxID=3391834 RepID=UPI0039C9ECAE
MISIITPSHNSSSYISSSIESVLSQNIDDWELIVIDDFSLDDSVKVIQSFVEKDLRIKLIRLFNNSGAAVARNKGIEAAQGRYIAFLDSDDLWLPDKLEKQIAFMKEQRYPFTYTAYQRINEYGQVIGEVGIPDRVCYSDLLKKCSIGCLTVIYDTDYFGKVYMPLTRKRQDLGLWLCLLKKINYAHGISESLAQYRVHSDSISSNKINAAKYTWRLYRDVEGLNLFKASYYFLHYAINGLMRTKFPKIARLIGMLK